MLPLWLILTLAQVPVSAGLSRTVPTSVEDYADIVHQYLKGGSTEAVRRLSEASLEELMVASQDYRQSWLMDSQLKAAALLHTQVAWSTGRDESFHLETARGFLDEIKEESQRTSFMGRWFLTLGYHFYSTFRNLDASLCFREALRWMPGDPELLLAQNSLIECSAWMLGDISLLGESQQVFLKLLDENPDDAELRIRLGHIYLLWERIRRGHSTGRPERVPKRRWYEVAERELERGLENADQPNLRLTAWLLLGDIYRERDQMDRAVDCYRAGVEIDPGCQAAAVALSLTLRVSGDREGSRQVMRQFLRSRAEPDGSYDGWWRYLLGHSHRWVTLLEELQEEMRR